jgi:hypothetical protein
MDDAVMPASMSLRWMLFIAFSCPHDGVLLKEGTDGGRDEHSYRSNEKSSWGVRWKQDLPMLRTRRRLLRAAVIGPVLRALQAARKEFWETKEPSAWSEEEKQILLGNSPWARLGIVRFEAANKRGGTPGSYPGAPRPGTLPGAAETVPFGERPPPVPSTDTGRSIQFRVLARWETAATVRLAGGPELPAGTAPFYVLRLQGMPLLPPPNTNEGLLEAIKQSSRLERKDKAAIPCAHLLTGSGKSATELLLFFPRGTDPITVDEKLVTLECRFTPFHLSIKFPLKEMLYKGALAL